jgi:hypothetical protein
MVAMKIDKCFDWLVRFAYPGVHEGCVWSEIPLQGRLSFYSSSPPTGESSPRKRVLSRLCAAGARKMSKPQNGSRFLHTGAARPRPIRQQQQPGSISIFISHHATHVSHNSHNILMRARYGNGSAGGRTPGMRNQATAALRTCCLVPDLT